MSLNTVNIEELSVNTIRCLSMDAIEKAKSGHPGMPMGCAPLAYTLYTKILKHNPSNPGWWNRDRFVLSAGHGSMLLYSILHLCGYEISLDDIKNFRQLGSLTAGHPEVFHTPGVETTTGPLGQGFANAVGMAVARNFLAAKFNKPGYEIVSGHITGIVSDGDIMEGISHEAASFAGTNKIGKLVLFYDNNNITIDGSTDKTMTEDVGARFRAYHWEVLHIKDVNDLNEVENVARFAFSIKNKPVLVITDTTIGYGSPNKAGSESSHGAPLGEDEVAMTKENLGWEYKEDFFVPDEVRADFEAAKGEGIIEEEKWKFKFEKYKGTYPELAKLYKAFMSGNLNDDWKKELPVYNDYTKSIATRKISGEVIQKLKDIFPNMMGGSADLAGSNNTTMKGVPDFSPQDYSGRNINFGIREHAMGAILNGMALYGGVMPYGATFMIFSEYMRPALRMAALMKLAPKYVFTHDSIGLGEDGPTHQPVEQLAALRAIPNLYVIRPADANETVEAWKTAIEMKDAPVLLALTRQGLPVIDRSKYAPADDVKKGAYVLKYESKEPELILIGTGSEVYVCIDAAEKLEAEGISTRVVSFPSWELFEKQDAEYRESVLPKAVKARLVVEAGIRMGWEKYIGLEGDAVTIETFGSSAPNKVLFEKFGFTAENVVNKSKELLQSF